MNQSERKFFEKRLLSISKGLDYPRTPDIAGMGHLYAADRARFISRRLAWSLTVILIVLSSLMLIPPARAAIIEFIQIGIVRIFPGSIETTPIPEMDVPLTATPSSSSLIPMLDRIAGKTTLVRAQEKASFPILLPAYPTSLGNPDHVYLQEAEGTMVILVWVDPEQPEKVLLSLHFIPPGSWAIHKVEPTVIQETKVHGRQAVWAEGPYALRFYAGDIQFMRLIDGHVLIWTEDDTTYRLETDATLEEALKIAESLVPAFP